MIRCTVKGNFNNTRRFLDRIMKLDLESILSKYAEEGVEVLSSATPVRSGATANSWGYEIIREGTSVGIYWTNSNINQGVPIAVILDFGHGTGTGGYVQGRHYISPAIRPVLEEIADAAWKEVTKN